MTDDMTRPGFDRFAENLFEARGHKEADLQKIVNKVDKNAVVRSFVTTNTVQISVGNKKKMQALMKELNTKGIDFLGPFDGPGDRGRNLSIAIKLG